MHTIRWSVSPAYYEKGLIDENGVIQEDKWDGTPDPIIEMLQGLADWQDVAVESATGTGKTFIAACIVLWFLDVYGDPKRPQDDCLVITLAPKEDQLKKLLWKEIGKLWPKFQEVHPQAQLLSLEIRMGRPNWAAYGYPVAVGAQEDIATKAAGHHGKHMLFVMEEAPGIPMPIFEAVENTCTAPHNLILAQGNPDRIDDALHEFSTRETTKHIQISAYDAPNVVCGDSEVIPGAVTQESIDKRLAKYKDPDHPLFKSRVRGICPQANEKCLFTEKALELARANIMIPKRIMGVPPRSEGTIKIFHEAEKTHLNRYILFADVAGDDGRGDAHAATMYDRLIEKIVATINMRGLREDYITAILKVCELYKVFYPQLSAPNDPRYFYPLFAWEKTGGSGSLILDERVKVYPNVYRSRNVEHPDPNLRSTVGWDTTGRTRPMMVEALRELGYDLYERPWRVPDEEYLEEMSKFVWARKGRSGRYEASSGANDDRVISLGGILMIDKLLPPVTPILPEKEKKRKKKTPYEQHLQRMSSPRSKGDGIGSGNDPWNKTKLPNYKL